MTQAAITSRWRGLRSYGSLQTQQLTGEFVTVPWMYNPSRGGNVMSPHGYAPLHVFARRQADRHMEGARAVNVCVHVSYSCILLLRTCATSSFLGSHVRK